MFPSVLEQIRVKTEKPNEVVVKLMIIGNPSKDTFDFLLMPKNWESEGVLTPSELRKRQVKLHSFKNGAASLQAN